MWRTPAGVRFASGFEAELLRELLGCLYDEVDTAVRYDDPGLAAETGVRLFDQLQPTQQVALLAEVGQALLDPNTSPPELTAVREATIAALMETLRCGILFEAERQVVDEELVLDWRQLLIDCLAEQSLEDDEVHAADCTDAEEWEYSISSFASNFLWDADYDMEDITADLGPEHSSALHALMRFPDDYFSEVAPDPLEKDLPSIRAQLNAITGCSHDLS